MSKLTDIKICLIAGDLGRGGAERQLFYILKTLKEQGANPRLLSLTQGEFWQERIESLGIPVTWVGTAGTKLQRLFSILKEVAKNRPTIFQSQHFYTNPYASVVARILGIREIAAMRNNGIKEVQANGRILGWLSLHMPRMIAANSRAAIRYATGRGIRPERLFHLPNVVDTDFFKPVPRAAANEVRLVSVGRIEPQKRFDRYLECLGRLRTLTNIQFKASIVGQCPPGSPLKEQLERQAVQLGLPPDILEFEGPIEDMKKVYDRADVCVLTSDFEGTPNVLLESMACGIPVVATRVGGIPDIVEEGRNGLLSDREDVNGLTAHLCRLVENPELRQRMGREGRSYIEANHSMQCLPEKLETLYGRALAGS